VKRKLWEVGAFKDVEKSKVAFEALQENEYIRYKNLPLRAKDGRVIQVEFVSNVYLAGDKQVIQCNIRNITERVQAEEALAKSVQAHRILFENVPVGLYVTSVDGRLIDANPEMVKMLGYKDLDKLLETNIVDLYVDPGADERFKSEIKKSDNLSNFMVEFHRHDGGTFWAEEHIHVARGEEGNPLLFVGSLIDITERESANERIRFHASLLNAVGEAIIATDLNGTVIYWNNTAEKIFGWTMDEALGREILDVTQSDVSKERALEFLSNLRTGNLRNGEFRLNRKDGSSFPAFVTDSPVHDQQGKLLGIIGVSNDISRRKQAEKRSQRQFDHLSSLREIDQVITASFDLHSNLGVILQYVIRELGVDATDVLLLNPVYQILEYSARLGFRTKTAAKASVRLGESHAGRVALERQLIQIPNLKDQPNDLLLTRILAGEEFVSYFGVPLISKGSIKGVLEVYNRTPIEPDQEWLDFLNTLASQAAIAIDNTHLFDNLQRSNVDLTLAYDATIEGWSRAMDLRDKETEGHTLRVTAMTLELAGLFGIKDEELVGIRRGALLHDIGKMGVPDPILLKTGALTDEEWVLMKKHPTFAFEMLSPIHYLRYAMDIPYCHHEKWDGTGYPRGLKGEQIPLAARIFAVVDVWDALISDRPYRKAWSGEKVLAYLKSEAGTHFDPEVVKIVLESGLIKDK
jgi:PAS domain S-box-containing protein/putative nucleotidyltransferase with HDIG domain